MSSDHDLDVLSLAPVVYLFAGDSFGWTWYVRVAAWAVVLTLFAIVAQRCRVGDGKEAEQHH